MRTLAVLVIVALICVVVFSSVRIIAGVLDEEWFRFLAVVTFAVAFLMAIESMRCNCKRCKTVQTLWGFWFLFLMADFLLRLVREGLKESGIAVLEFPITMSVLVLLAGFLAALLEIAVFVFKRCQKQKN